MKRGN